MFIKIIVLTHVNITDYVKLSISNIIVKINDFYWQKFFRVNPLKFLLTLLKMRLYNIYEIQGKVKF